MTILPKKKVTKDPAAPVHVSDGSESESEGELPTLAPPTTSSTHELDEKAHYGYHHYSPTPDLYRQFSSSSGESSPELPVLSKDHYRRGQGGRVNATPSPQHSGYNSSEEHDCPRNIYIDIKKEQMFEEALKRERGLVIKKMRPDGACLFRAVADQVYGDQEMHAIVRNHCLDYMIKNTDYFSQFVTEDFEHYISRKRSDRCYGNYLEMQAIAEMYNRCIEVYQYSTDPINTFFGIYKTDNPPIRLSYHSRIHYNSVVDPYEPSVGVGLGLAGFKPGIADKNLMSEAKKESEIAHLEQTMFQDKIRTSDWDATYEAIEQAVSQESYLLWLKEQETKSVNNGGPSRIQSDVQRSQSSPLPPSTAPTVSSHHQTSPTSSYHTVWKPLTFVPQRARSRSRSSSRSNSKSPQTGRRSPGSAHGSTHNSPTRTGRTSPRVSGRNSSRSGSCSPTHSRGSPSKPTRAGSNDGSSSFPRQLTPPLSSPASVEGTVINTNTVQNKIQSQHSKSASPLTNSVNYESGQVQCPLPFEYSSFLDLPPSAFGLLEWEGDQELAAVLAASQQEYLDSLKPNSRGAEGL